MAYIVKKHTPMLVFSKKVYICKVMEWQDLGGGVAVKC